MQGYDGALFQNPIYHLYGHVLCCTVSIYWFVSQRMKDDNIFTVDTLLH